MLKFQADYDPALQRVISCLRNDFNITKTGLYDGVSLTATTRPAKTIETLREKLRRGLALRAVQDIVGVRVVGRLALSQQDALVSDLRARLPATRIDVDDRRVAPSFGYRAVHVIPHVDGFPVEIQIRTGWQNSWAQGSEKFGDLWGRWHRYGLPPEGATPKERTKRSDFMSLYRDASDAIYSHEKAIDARFKLERLRAEIEGGLVPDGATLERLDDQLLEARAEESATSAVIADYIRRMNVVIGVHSER